MNDLKFFLKAKKIKINKSKKRSFFLLKTKKPKTVEEIFRKINLKKKNIDRTTIYRILENFLKLGIVNKVKKQDLN